MSEIYHPAQVEGISQKQETGLHLALELTRARLASQDPLLQTQSLSELDTHCESALLPEKRRIRRIDIMEQLSPFSEEEIKTMVRNLFAIELNEGCNGHCYFCFLKALPGVRAMYTFESLQIFFEKYSPMFPREVIFYWASDPFDYQDGDKTIWDVYQIYYKNKKIDTLHSSISTALPKGSERRFKQFALNLMEKHKERYRNWNWYQESYYYPPVSLRISVGEQNAQRVEQMLEDVYLTLKQKGYSDSEIKIFFDYCLKTEDRFDVLQHGRLIRNHDDIQDASSFSCNDGVVASPAGWTARIVTAPTIYEPTGEKTIPLLPGKVKEYVPRYQHTRGFDTSRFTLAFPFLELPKNTFNQPIKLENETENSILKLGRIATSLAKFVILLTRLEKVSKLEKTLHNAQEPFGKMSKLANMILSQSETSLTMLDVAEERDRLSFYVLLCQTYLSQVNFLMRQYAQGRSVREIATMARAFRSVGRDNLEDLAELMQGFNKRGLKPRRWFKEKVKAFMRKRGPAL